MTQLHQSPADGAKIGGRGCSMVGLNLSVLVGMAVFSGTVSSPVL